MLKEIWCDKFISNGKKRGIIKFNNGLNAVVGNQSGTNSVGKSTFLMVIDFVLGGDDYLSKSKEVHEEIGEHIIYFKFEFGGEEFYFARSTNNRNKVCVCNEKYDIVREISLTNYLSILREKYELFSPGMTFRNVVGRFLRIARRETLNPDKPFASAASENDGDAILGMLKLFGVYHAIECQEASCEEALLKEETFKNAQKYNYIPNVKNKTEYNKNCIEIDVLKKEIEKLINESSRGVADLDSLKAETLRTCKNKISALKRRRTRLQHQLDKLTDNVHFSNKKLQNNFSELQLVFSNINVDYLQKVESFHKNISGILKQEISGKTVDLKLMIDYLTSEITKLEAEQNKILDISDVKKAVLEQYGVLISKLEKLQAANNAYDKKHELHGVVKTKKEELNALIVSNMQTYINAINTTMKELNDKLYCFKVNSPILSVEAWNRYSLSTPKDTGSGVRDKGLILFDLAVLKNTKLPLIVHDSVLLLQIENEVLEKLLELYAKLVDKQIFIAFDKVATKKECDILAKCEVIHLSRGGNELFGRSWNKQPIR